VRTTHFFFQTYRVSVLVVVVSVIVGVAALLGVFPCSEAVTLGGPLSRRTGPRTGPRTVALARGARTREMPTANIRAWARVDFPRNFTYYLITIKVFGISAFPRLIPRGLTAVWWGNQHAVVVMLLSLTSTHAPAFQWRPRFSRCLISMRTPSLMCQALTVAPSIEA